MLLVKVKMCPAIENHGAACGTVAITRKVSEVGMNGNSRKSRKHVYLPLLYLLNVKNIQFVSKMHHLTRSTSPCSVRAFTLDGPAFITSHSPSAVHVPALV